MTRDRAGCRLRTVRRLRRGGATLTEVLMALLVMGLGVAGVAALFPIAVLRSVEATKLTHATLLRQNAEAYIRFLTSRAEDASPPGTTDADHPPILRALITDPDKDYNTREHEGTKYVVDPLGANVMAADGFAGLAGTFGWKDNDGDGTFDAGESATGFARYSFKLGAAAAQNLVMLPDSFVPVADVIGSAATVSGSGTAYTVTIPEVDLTEYVSTPPSTAVRVTVFRADVPASVVLDGTVASATTISTTQGLPAAYSGNVGRVVVEVPERRYTWLATVRNFGPKPSVTIVIFFRRSFSPADEQAVPVSEPVNTFNQFRLAAGVARPEGLKPGGFMFDTAAFRWLRIVSVPDEPAADGTLTFKTDPSEVDPFPAPGAPFVAGKTVDRTFQAMFPRNVVEAYTLKKD